MTTTAIPSLADRLLLLHTATEFDALLRQNYAFGFGVMPSADPADNFYAQLWTRDLAHAAGNYFVYAEPQAVIDSLRTLFAHQRPVGSLPLRVEREYMLLKIVPGLRWLARPLFNLIEKKLRGRMERPVYEGQDFTGAEDTVPMTVIAAGELFLVSNIGCSFIVNHFRPLIRAVNYFFEKKVDVDGLAIVQPYNPDWADSLKRGGKLGGINVWWARSLQLMKKMSLICGYPAKSKQYGEWYAQTRQSIYEQLFVASGGYIRAATGDDRMDVVASIFGALHLFDAVTAVRLEETIERTVKRSSGLQNYHPPYAERDILMPHRLIGHAGYHNVDVWPWVTCQNIMVKIKIAREHHDEAVRERYRSESVRDLLDAARLFNDAGGAYEIFHPDTRRPAIKRWYTPPRHFMGSMAGFMGVYRQIKKLGWI